MASTSSSELPTEFFFLRPEHSDRSFVLLHPAEYDARTVAILEGECRPHAPLVFSAASFGDEPIDVALWAFTPVISRRVADAWERAGVSGYELHPASVVQWEGLFYVVSALGRCGPKVRARSRTVRREPPSPRGLPADFEVGLYFDESTWDGTDLFLVDGTFIALCTPRLREITELEAVRTECVFRSQHDYEVLAPRLRA